MSAPRDQDDMPLPAGEWVSRPRWEDAVYARMSTPTGKAVVMRLGRHMKWRDGKPGYDGEPGNALLAAEVGVSERQVQRCLDEARRQGLIEMTRRHNNRRTAHPQAAYAARMPSVQALPMPVDPPPVPAPRPDTHVRWSASDDRTPMSGGDVDDRTSASGRGADDRTWVSGSTQVKNLKEPPPSAAPAQAALLVPVSGGGGSTPSTTTDTAPAESVPADVRIVLDAVAGHERIRIGDRDRALLAGPVAAALAAGWEAAVLGAHLTADLPVRIPRPRGLMLHRLQAGTGPDSRVVLPESPAVCGCTACVRHTAAVEAEIRRETERLARARAVEQRQAVVDANADAAVRHDAIDAEIGPVLHGRIIAAVLAGNPIHRARQLAPARVRALAANVYADHQHDVAAIRAYAEALPPGPQESAPATGPDGLPLTAVAQTAASTTESPAPTPTHPDGTVRPSLAELEAAIAARIAGAA